MARFSPGSSLHILNALEADQPIRTSGAQFRLSWRGRLVTTAFLLPGIASAMSSMFLPNADQGGMFSLAAVTFYVGGFTVGIAYAWTLMYAHWTTPALRKFPDLDEWNLAAPRAWLPPVAGWTLVGANVAAAAWFGLLSSRLRMELVPAGLYLVAAAVNARLTVASRR
jgi:hypothetical protein